MKIQIGLSKIITLYFIYIRVTVCYAVRDTDLSVRGLIWKLTVSCNSYLFRWGVKEENTTNNMFYRLSKMKSNTYTVPCMHLMILWNINIIITYQMKCAIKENINMSTGAWLNLFFCRKLFFSQLPQSFQSKLILEWSQNILADYHRKNRYVQICYHSRINRATSLKFSGPVYHPIEQLKYKFYVYISNDIDFIQLFVTYPYLLKTNKCVKSAF